MNKVLGKRKILRKPRVQKRDCNQCGDYEYCAFQWDKCTGFIPGDNYVFEKIWEKRNRRSK